MINKCENCGGRIFFSPKNKGNVCEKCGSVFSVEFISEFNKKGFENAVPIENDQLVNNLTNFNCASCGASVLVSKGQLKAQCAYCGDSSLVESRKTSLMFIDSLIPFSCDKEDALEAVKTKIKKNIFARKDVFKKIDINNISGTYVNAFVFDMSTFSKYDGVFSYTRTYKTNDGKTKTETVRKHVSGDFSKLYKNLTIEANSNLEQSELNSVEPFNYPSAVKFKEDFLNGYMLEYQDKSFKDCVSTAEQIINNDIKRCLLRKHNCDRIESLNLTVEYPERSYNYCLLPIYFTHIKDEKKNNNYNILMNGQTGKVGKVPLSGWKIFFFIFGICAIITALILSFVLL